MRFAHVRPMTVGFVTGGVLVAAATGLTVAASAAQSSLPVTMTAASAVTVAGASVTGQQCESLLVSTPSPTPTPTPTPTQSSPSPSPSTPSPSDTPSPSPSQTSPSPTASPTDTGSPSPSVSTSPSPATTDQSPSPSPSDSGGTTSSATPAGTSSSGSTTAATVLSDSVAPLTAAATTPQVSLCVAVQRTHASIERGKAAQWIVTAWTRGGNVPGATIRLVAAPTGLTPEFSIGCGSRNGTPLCDLGTVDAKSAKRELQAQVAVPVTATTVTSVRLTAIASAAHLAKKPKVTSTVTVTAPPPGAVIPIHFAGAPELSTSPLSIGSLPFLPAPSSTLSPGGNAAGLFPTLQPATDPPSAKPADQNAGTTPVANNSALPLGAPVVGGQLVGLGVLALAFVLAISRLSVRKRPAPVSAAEPGKPADGSAKPAAGGQPASGESAGPQAPIAGSPPAPPAEPSQSADQDQA